MSKGNECGFSREMADEMKKRSDARKTEGDWHYDLAKANKSLDKATLAEKLYRRNAISLDERQSISYSDASSIQDYLDDIKKRAKEHGFNL